MGLLALRKFALRMCGSKFMYLTRSRFTTMGPYSADLHLWKSRA